LRKRLLVLVAVFLLLAVAALVQRVHARAAYKQGRDQRRVHIGFNHASGLNLACIAFFLLHLCYAGNRFDQVETVLLPPGVWPQKYPKLHNPELLRVFKKHWGARNLARHWLQLQFGCFCPLPSSRTPQFSAL
jgi:hypothetical protein